MAGFNCNIVGTLDVLPSFPDAHRRALARPSSPCGAWFEKNDPEGVAFEHEVLEQVEALP